MRSYLAGLQNSVGSSYLSTRTTVAGRAFQKNIGGQQVIGPPLTAFLDTETTAALAPTWSYFNPSTNRLMVLSAASASPTVTLFNFNNSTGVSSYVGKITLTLANLAATTHTFRGFKFDDSNSSSIKVFLSTTGSVLINGGTYMAYGLALSDFTPGGTTIWAAQSSGQKGMYFLQDSGATGAANVATSAWGTMLPFKSATSGINTKVYQFNGTVAVPVVYAWDYSGTPAVANTYASQISAQTTLYAGTSPSAFFTSGVNSVAVLNANDPVVLTGTVPTGFTASTGTAAQTVYFIRDIQLVSGSYYFNLAATSGGAAITPTGAASGFTMMRAFGTSTNLFSFKTGALPALSGLILQANSVDWCMPTSAPLNSALNGLDCFYLATTTTLYLGKVSELSSGATSWPSLTGANNSGTGTDYVAATIANAVYSNELDRFVFVTNTSTYVVKPLQNSIITAVFGGLTTSYYEGVNPTTVQAGLAAISGFSVLGGWMFVSGSTTGQRGVIACDLQSDAMFGFSYVTSPVLQANLGSVLRFIDTIEQLFDLTDSLTFQFRTAATAADATFSSATTPWTTIATAQDLSAFAVSGFIQFRILFGVLTFDANTPAQVNDIVYTLNFASEMSDNWAFDKDSSTSAAATPSYVAFYQTRLYLSGGLPTNLFVRGNDTSGNLISQVNDNVGANPSLFSYSTDGGTTWTTATSISSIPNVVGTKLRYNAVTPPGVEALVSLRES